jgi:hypothetical protein
VPGVGVCGPCPDFASHSLAFALQLRKIKEILSQGSQKRSADQRRKRFV